MTVLRASQSELVQLGFVRAYASIMMLKFEQEQNPRSLEATPKNVVGQNHKKRALS